jgi:hypothetical protein
MAATQEAQLGLYKGWSQGEAGWNDYMTENINKIGAVIQLGAKDKDLNTPPGSPTEGDRYIVGSSPTDTWTGQSGKIAVRLGATWTFLTPKEGWRCWLDDEDGEYIHNGTAWLLWRGSGTTANRPASAMAGATYFDTTTGKPNFYSGSGWVLADGTAA